jgi:hypothetical protein
MKEEAFMRRIVNAALIAVALALMATTPVWATVTPYSQDFEGLVQSDPAALADNGWLVFGNVFDLSGTYLYGYRPFPAPNGGPAFSAIAAGEGGPPQGAQQLSVYSDYNNGDHPTALIETNVYQEQTIAATDPGNVVTFTFDAKRGNLEGSSEAAAFIKTLDPDAGFATTRLRTEDMTAIPTTWGTYSIELTIDSGLVGQILQFGFVTRATNFQGSGIFYDNLNVEVEPDEPPPPDDGPAIPTLSTWSMIIFALLLAGAALLKLRL